MGWSGRAPAPPAIEAGKGRQDKEHAMSQTLNAAIAVVGIDIGKNSFHIVGKGSGRDASDIAFLTSDKECQVDNRGFKSK